MALKHVLIVQSQGRETSLEEAHLRACYPCRGPDLIACHFQEVFFFFRWQMKDRVHDVMLACGSPMSTDRPVVRVGGRRRWAQAYFSRSADRHFYRLESKSRFVQHGVETTTAFVLVNIKSSQSKPPVIVTSLRHTCAITMLLSQHLNLPDPPGGGIILAKDEVLLRCMGCSIIVFAIRTGLKLSFPAGPGGQTHLDAFPTTFVWNLNYNRASQTSKTESDKKMQKHTI